MNDIFDTEFDLFESNELDFDLEMDMLLGEDTMEDDIMFDIQLDEAFDSILGGSQETVSIDQLIESGVVGTIGKAISDFAVKTTYAFEDLMDIIGQKDTLFRRMQKIVVRTAKDAKRGEMLAILKVVFVVLLMGVTAVISVLNADAVTAYAKQAGEKVGDVLGKAAKWAKLEDAGQAIVKFMYTATEYVWGVFDWIGNNKVSTAIKSFFEGIKKKFNEVTKKPQTWWAKFKAKLGFGSADLAAEEGWLLSPQQIEINKKTNMAAYDGVVGESTLFESTVEEIQESKFKSAAAHFIIIVVAVGLTSIISIMLVKGYEYINPIYTEKKEKIVAFFGKYNQQLKDWAGFKPSDANA